MFSPTSGRLVPSILQCFVCLIHCDPGLEPWTLGTEGSGAFANMRLPQTHWPPKPSRSRLRLQYQHLPTIKMWSTMIHYINFTHLNGAFVFSVFLVISISISFCPRCQCKVSVSELPKVEALGIELRQTSGYAAPVNVQTGELTRHTALGELGFMKFMDFWNVLDGYEMAWNGCWMRGLCGWCERDDAWCSKIQLFIRSFSILALLVGRSLSGNKSLSPVPVKGGWTVIKKCCFIPKVSLSESNMNWGLMFKRTFKPSQARKLGSFWFDLSTLPQLQSYHEPDPSMWSHWAMTRSPWVWAWYSWDFMSGKVLFRSWRSTLDGTKSSGAPSRRPFTNTIVLWPEPCAWLA